MSHRLIDLNDDLRKLRDAGFNVDIHAGHLIVRDIPYVNDKRQVCRDGILVTSLDLNGDITNRPGDHTIKFVGDHPCSSDGQLIAGIKHNSDLVRISESITTRHSFSSKPPRGHYENYYEKIKTYAAIIEGHASVIDQSATSKTYQVVVPEDDNSPFQYIDTASARVDINMITQKLAVEKLAIVGLGGTGSYVLDFIAKTPVKEIHLFDGDKFSSHNAFRAPGAASIDDLHRQMFKVDYLKEIYSRMHKGIIAHPVPIDTTNIDQLDGMSHVFLCMDAGPAKKTIVEYLEQKDISFIDTGIGIYAKDEKLGGILRTTSSTSSNRENARSHISFVPTDQGANEYDKNIQVADLNALNAIQAVIKWKKMRGFYFDTKKENFSTYTIGGNMLLNDTDETD
ncbi:MAG: ThiF family adenylyltransferase [Candidatus Paceibacterota bacterium]